MIQIVLWEIPHIQLSVHEQVNLYQSITKGLTIPIAFRSWDLYTYPDIPHNTGHHIWNVKTTSQIEKSRYIIFALQTNKKNSLTTDSLKFDHCNITDVKVHLNSEYYPNENLDLNFERNRFASLFMMYQTKNGPVDVKIEFKTNKQIPSNTTAYCLMIHDRLIEYNPLGSSINKII
ncbi:uncharacterized protein LOC129609447 [Condylostylus longicornis]|uniref:uncharacterized protein LOC129609447 n=1 Tax=Condylostylus longicornis TaxID=2530218 RepID=UPI00244DA3F7|nr:uncharacterized protein LOC129609447 [Condylostylus longicornis]